METIRASSKGQIVIPKTIREALHIGNGTELNVELLPGEGFKVTVRMGDHSAQVSKLAGSLSPLGKKKGRDARLTDEHAVLRAVNDDDRRIRGYARRARRGSR